MRKRLVPILGAVALAAIVTGCSSPSSPTGSPTAAADGETIKIALIPPASGALAEHGTNAVRGWELAVDMVNAEGGINGQLVELVEKSTDATPETTVRAAREAVTRDGAQFIGAVMTSPEHGALNQQLANLGALSFNSLGKDDALIGAQCSANAFHIVQTTRMDINALATTLADLPAERWAIQAVDYATGHTAAEVFTAAAEEAGKEVVLTQFAPLNTTDFGSYITTLQQSDADGLFAVEFGADGTNFVKQAEQFALTDKFDTVLGFNMVSEPLFEAMGPGILVFYNNVGYDVSGTEELNTEFVEAYTEKFGEAPYYVPADNFLAAQTLFAGIEAAGSADPEAVSEALNDLTFDSIVGEVTLRGADHQLVRPSYLGQVVESEDGPGGLGFEIRAEAAGEDITPEPDPACSI